MKGVWFFLFVLTSCSRANLWQYEEITALSSLYESSRLLYRDPTSSSPLRFEITRLGNEVLAYLNLTHYKFSEEKMLSLKTECNSEVWEESLPLVQGRMHLRLPEEVVSKIIQGLIQGHDVKLSVDGFEETLKSENFASFYQKLVQNTSFLQNVWQEEN